MRNGQNKRMRGRNNNHRKNHNPMVRVYESNGPDVKIRGNPSHIAEKYIQLARDAQTSGDPIAAENYYQHAEHYYRVIAVAQEQFRQNNPHFARGENETAGRARRRFRRRRRRRAIHGRCQAIRPTARASRSPISRAMHNPFRSNSRTSLNVRSKATQPPKAMSSGCRPSSPAGNSRSSSLTKASSRGRTAMTTSPTVSRCTAGGGGIAARAPTFRAAVTAETSRPRASDRSRSAVAA